MLYELSTKMLMALLPRFTAIPFLGKNKQEKVNTNENGESGQEIFEETWKNINVNSLIKLSEIKEQRMHCKN